MNRQDNPTSSYKHPRYTTAPGADTSAQDYLNDQGSTKSNDPDPLTDLVHRIFMAGYKAGKQSGLTMVIVSDTIEPAAVAELEQIRIQDRLEVVMHIMSAKTEGLFDRGDLFVKRAPIEQACIDLVGYEAFKAFQESLPVPDLSQLTPKEN